MAEHEPRHRVSHRLLDFATRNIEKMIEIDFPEEYQMIAARLIADGKYPIVISNHDSQANIFPLVAVAEMIRAGTNHLILCGATRQTPLEGFYLPVAASVTGKQGKMVAAFYDAVTPFLQKNHILPMSVTREQDVQNYGVDAGTNTGSLKELLGAHNTNHGLAMFLTGSVQEARIGKDGKRIGLQPCDRKSLFTQMVLNTDAVIIPIANCHGYELTDPAHGNKPTRHAIGALIHNSVFDKPRVLSKAVVGKPFCFGLPPNFSSHSYINNQTLSVIAQMLPPEQQGAFRQQYI